MRKYAESCWRDLKKWEQEDTATSCTIEGQGWIKGKMCSPTVINNWNKLPDEMVKAESVWTFEKKLDRLEKNQRLKYDYKENSEMNSENQHV